MENNHRTALKSFGKGQGKDKHFQGQTQRVFTAFLRHPKTMLVVSIETDILRINICRYVAEWEKENRICIVRKGICPISKHRAGFTPPIPICSLLLNLQILLSYETKPRI